MLSLLLLTTKVSLATNATSSSADNQALSKGNFALPASQQPGPFYSFGQNIINKGLAQLYLLPSYASNQQQHDANVIPSLLYGLTDNASLLLSAPIAADYSSQNDHSSGLGDVTGQFEYAFFNNSDSQATLVAALSLPTGAFSKTPPLGLGAPSYFLGSTYNQTLEKWLWFVSPGILVISPKNNIHPGNQYLYQLGVGRNIHSVTASYIVSSLVELDGEYTDKDRSFGSSIPDTGGNVVYITPSLWFSTKTFILQAGISLPIIQQLNGIQNKNYCIASFSLAWNLN